MDLLDMLQKHLSPTDFERMVTWMSSLPPEERSAMMQFINDRETRAPAVGEDAPDFHLPLLDGSEHVHLSSFRGIKPVALIFGSFT